MNALIPPVDHYDPYPVPIADVRAAWDQPPLPGIEVTVSDPDGLSPEAVSELWAALDAAVNRRAE